MERLAAREPICWLWDTAIPDGHDDDRSAFRAWHSGRCAVCGYRDARLVDDHDHETGLIRGLLCRSCNGREPYDDGLFRKYRERPSAQILGIRLRYWDPFRGWALPRDTAPDSSTTTPPTPSPPNSASDSSRNPPSARPETGEHRDRGDRRPA